MQPPTIAIIELSSAQHGQDAYGGHAWIEVEFASGHTVTVRVDELGGTDSDRPAVYLSYDGEIGRTHDL
jgi:hypothetical protein